MTENKAEHDVILNGAPGAMAWLEEAGFSGQVRELSGGTSGIVEVFRPDGARQVLEWRPQSFKQVLSRALALGAATGCQAGMMKVIAEGESRLANMRDRLGIDRKAAPEALAPCVVLVDGLPSSDLWVPDLIDRAAGRLPEDEIPGHAHIVRFGPDILIPGPHLYDAVLRIARELYPNRT